MRCPQTELNQSLVPFIQEQLAREQVLLDQELRSLLLHFQKCQTCCRQAIGLINSMLECGHAFTPTLIERVQALKEELQKFNK